MSRNRLTSLSSLPLLPALTDLYASRNRIESVAGLAQRAPALEVLDVTDNRVEEGEAVALVRGSTALQELWVRGNPLCDSAKCAAPPTPARGQARLTLGLARSRGQV